MREGDTLTGWLRPVYGRTNRTHRFVDGRALCGYIPRMTRTFRNPPAVDMMRCKRCVDLSVTRFKKEITS